MVVRQLTYNPNILNTRGFVDTDRSENPAIDYFGPAELLNPFTNQHADPPRELYAIYKGNLISKFF